MYNYLPSTYEEYGKLNDFGPLEMEGQEAEEAKRLYEKMAAILNQIKPLKDDEDNVGCELMDMVELYREKGYMTDEIYMQMMDFIENEDLSPEMGFIVDELLEFFHIV